MNLAVSCSSAVICVPFGSSCLSLQKCSVSLSVGFVSLYCSFMFSFRFSSVSYWKSLIVFAGFEVMYTDVSHTNTRGSGTVFVQVK